jgi:hypothetical protein
LDRILWGGGVCVGGGGWGVQFDFTSSSLRAQFDFTLNSIRSHLDSTSRSLRFHFWVSLRFHIGLTSSSLRVHFDVILSSILLLVFTAMGKQSTVHMCLRFFFLLCFCTCCSAWEHGQQFACGPHHNVSQTVKVRHARIRAVRSIDLRQNERPSSLGLGTSGAHTHWYFKFCIMSSYFCQISSYFHCSVYTWSSRA